MFSCEFCEISKNTFYYKTALVAASDSLRLFNLNPKQTSEILTVVVLMMRKKVKSKTNNSMVTMSGASTVQKQSLEDFLQNRCQPCNFIKKRLKHRRFPVRFTKSLRTPFFTEHLYSDGCFL